jgi:NADH-quinone oxidoreductase subunit N
VPFDPREFLLLAPEILLSLAGLLLLLVGTMGRGFGNRESALVSMVALGLTAWMLFRIQAQVPVPHQIMGGMFVIDGYAFVWKLIVLLATAITVPLSVRFLEEGRYRAVEYYALLLLATAGMLFMASGATLLTIWISLETMALASYILAGYFTREVRSTEAALKYFILGAMSSGVLLYGISLLYGAAGTVELDELARRLGPAQEAGSLLVPLGWLLLAAGLFFKVAAVPFHVWTPDVYVGAPTPVTAWLAAASKGASFAILLRIFYQGLGPLHLEWQWIVALVATASMVWGNLAALTQQNVKRMLAYSSIAHAGYVLIGVLAVSEIGLWAVVFYVLAYSFIILGAFGTVILLERKEYAGETCEDYSGLARRAPFLSAMMLLFLLALTGIPPTGGFVGKVYLFASAVESGWAWVAVVGVVTSAISLYYYFRVVVYMYLRDPTAAAPAPLPSRALVGAVALCALATLVMGVYPGPFIELAKTALLPLP